MSTVDDVLRYRRGVLLASAGALLHNLGKVSSRFVGTKVEPKWSKGYRYQHICGFFLEDVDNIGCHGGLSDWQKELYYDLTQRPENKDAISDETRKALACNIGELPVPFHQRLDINGRSRPYRVGDLIEYLGQGEGLYPQDITKIFKSSLLTHLMNRCHHGASGGEKQGIYELQQNLPLYLATPLGYERPAPDLTEYDEIKDKVEEVVRKHLSDPGKFSLHAFMAGLEPLFRRIPADTRRGVNDVTVWDIGHSGMAFLKAGIWSCVKQNGLKRQRLGQELKHDDFDEGTLSNYRPQDYHPRWRLWRVGLNGLDFLTGAVSVADLRVRRRLLREYLDRVRFLVEEAYPVATEVYRDENGSIYVFPDWDESSGEYESFRKRVDSALCEEETRDGAAGSEVRAGEVKGEVRKAAEAHLRLSLPELYGLRPAAQLSGENYHNHPECRKTSNIKYIGDAVREWIQNPPAAKPAFEAYDRDFKHDLCPYCGVRPIGGGEKLLEKLPEEERRRCTKEKARERRICRPCMYARGRITEEWWKKESFSTVWVDEVADANGRVALVVGKFGVEKVLGELVYPPDKVWLLQAKTVSGSVPPPGSEFECGGVRFKVLSHGPSTGDVEMVASNEIGLLREELELVAIDFSSSRVSTRSSLGRQPLSLDLRVSGVSLGPSSDEFVMECRDDKILEECRRITNQSNLRWQDLQGAACEIKAGNRSVSGRIDGPRKIRLDQSASHLLWTDGSGWYFYQKKEKGEYKGEYIETGGKYLGNYNRYRNKGFILFSAPSASFARFRRVWETTAHFWQEVAPLKEQAEDWQRELAASLAVEALGKEGRRRRLEIVLKDIKKPGEIVPFHAYELEVAGVSIGIVPVEVKDRQATCVTIENLGYIAKQLGASGKVCADPCAAAAYVQGKILERRGEEARIKEAQGYGPGKKDRGTAVVDGVRLAGEEYFPVIPVLANPRVFAALLPARAAVELVRRIHKKYAEEMGKVRWRLPLTLGTVFFPRHLPLRVVLDAGWRLLDQTGELPKATARVDKVERTGTAVHDGLKHPTRGSWPARVTVTAELVDPAPDRHDRQVKLEWEVSTVMGDRNTFDIWYPWVKAARLTAPADRPLSFRHGNETWVHVVELEEGDEIEFYPSTWDFVFLENAGERFAVAYKDGRRLGLRRRPYYLEEIDRLLDLWDELRRHLSSTQRHALWQVLLERYACWELGKSGVVRPAPAGDKAWQQFCRDALLGAQWKKGFPLLERLGEAQSEPPTVDSLTGLAASGVLFDLLELHLTILKESEEE
ncbi:hypothetical protein Adeg_0805 [Ammonifex degensii KC4]|uniref:CRISPR-associated protein Csx11 n=1 Tax=Ammonifex degensii (strain DSM 10501 / KC4) TaxID=429009 RepID=C9RCH0_AMMDK|nr:hypothetical protein [Ammonifex degensii]ACX51947.1 hypothetical protein Adeg_0805 [Ammonifex degensii KC4]